MDDDELWKHITRSVEPIDKSDITYQDVPDFSDLLMGNDYKSSSANKPSKKKKVKVGSTNSAFEKSKNTSLDALLMQTALTEPAKNQSHVQIDKRTEKRVRKGEMPIDGTLDLHGLRLENAHNKLRQFILSSYQQRKRCLLVVTGKGKRSEDGIGVIKASFPVWLSAPDLSDKVLQFYPAQPKHGGEGAFYVFLRRQRTQ
jgi:DNA-nicking Smr family endonuclease